jgi:hypothetical protein
VREHPYVVTASEHALPSPASLLGSAEANLYDPDARIAEANLRDPDEAGPGRTSTV